MPRYRRYASFIIAVLLLRAPSEATVIVVLVSNHTITFAADSKTVIVHLSHSVPNGSGTTRKIRRSPKGIVWGASGTERIGNDTMVGYDFRTFSDKVEKKITARDSVSGVAQLIRSSLAETFDGFDVLILSGAITQKDIPSGELERFFIGGYENGKPKVFRIDMDIDWIAKHLVGPTVVNLYPGECQRNSLSMCIAGQDAIKGLGDPNSDESKWALCRAPTEIRALGMDRDISADQSVLLGRMIVDLGIMASPETVGLPITVVSITPNGRSVEYTYRNRLPNRCTDSSSHKSHP